MSPLEPWIYLLLGGLFSALYVGRWVMGVSGAPALVAEVEV